MDKFFSRLIKADTSYVIGGWQLYTYEDALVDKNIKITPEMIKNTFGESAAVTKNLAVLVNKLVWGIDVGSDIKTLNIQNLCLLHYILTYIKHKQSAKIAELIKDKYHQYYKIWNKPIVKNDKEFSIDGMKAESGSVLTSSELIITLQNLGDLISDLMLKKSMMGNTLPYANYVVGNDINPDAMEVYAMLHIDDIDEVDAIKKEAYERDCYWLIRKCHAILYTDCRDDIANELLNL